MSGGGNRCGLLVEAFLALGVAFLTLAGAARTRWTLELGQLAFEGAALVWIGCRQNRKLPRASGALLQVAAGIIFWKDLHVAPEALPISTARFSAGS